MTKWSSSTSVTNSIAYDSGTDFAINTSTPLYRFTVQPYTNLNFGIGRTSLFASDDTVFMNAVNNTYGAIPMAINASFLGFYIGFSEAMRLDSSKNMLLGTTTGISGGGILQVNGDVNISGQFKINGTPIGTGGGGGNVYAGTQTTNYVTKWVGGNFIGNSNIFDNGSIVGIGTTGITGGGALQVAGDVNITGTFKVNGTAIGTGGGGVSGSGTTNKLAMWSSPTSLTDSGIYHSTYTGGNGIGFQPVGASAEVMRVENKGRVYIGASSSANAALALSVHAQSNEQIVTKLGPSTSTLFAIARFMQDETNFRGVGTGYDTSGNIGIVYASTPNNITPCTLKLVVYSGSAWVTYLSVNPKTVNLNIPKNPTGLLEGDLYKDDNGYVRIV